MKLKEALRTLKAAADEKVYKRNAKHGAGDNQYGVKLGDIRKLSKKIRTNHKLAFELWDTENLDARLLATLVIKPASLSTEEMDAIVRSASVPQLADWVNSYVVKNHPDKEALREDWMKTDDIWAARAGWNLTASRIVKSPEGLDLKGLLDRIESEMGDAAPDTQWTMNFALGEIGINFPKHRKRAMKIGESLGVFRDYPVSKGCISPFVPIWIQAMVDRQG
ncbi:MAG: 3-methyladenine DNA glycosylase AlkD [Planctomycetota bacterium]|jgi:3-methyladenine DNA glycosylase AlkD